MISQSQRLCHVSCLDSRPHLDEVSHWRKPTQIPASRQTTHQMLCRLQIPRASSPIRAMDCIGTWHNWQKKNSVTGVTMCHLILLPFLLFRRFHTWVEFLSCPFRIYIVPWTGRLTFLCCSLCAATEQLQAPNLNRYMFESPVNSHVADYTRSFVSPVHVWQVICKKRERESERERVRIVREREKELGSLESLTG